MSEVLEPTSIPIEVVETEEKEPNSEHDFAYDVLIGLSAKPKRLSSKYFYDAEGSKIFQKIMELPEYYLTKCEEEVLLAHASKILAPFTGTGGGQAFNLVDLGAGDGLKTRILLEEGLRSGGSFTFVPIDISEAAVAGLVGDLRRRYPELKVHGLVAEYVAGLHRWASSREEAKNLVLFLGSNIGNFGKFESRALLRRLWHALRPGDRLLIGFDLKKDIEVLLHAYNDRRGVTASFNMNLLSRINRELGADFDLDAFRHFGTYNVFTGAMESYIVSQRKQEVFIEAIGRSFRFDEWEPIHTEYSYKYLRRDIHDMAADTGFAVEAVFEDSRGWFADALWRVVKEERSERG